MRALADLHILPPPAEIPYAGEVLEPSASISFYPFDPSPLLPALRGQRGL